MIRNYFWILLFPTLLVASGCGHSNQYLVDAVGRGDILKVEQLVGKGANINTKNVDGLTLLMIAALNNQQRIVEFLINRGATVREKEKLHGQTALHLAAQEGNYEIVKLLIDAGADVNVDDNSGWPAMFYAIQRKQIKCVSVILSSSHVNPDLMHEGVTPLYLAVYHNDTDIVRLLLKVGASPYAKTRNGETPFELAESRKIEQLVKIFQSSHSAIF